MSVQSITNHHGLYSKVTIPSTYNALAVIMVTLLVKFIIFTCRLIYVNIHHFLNIISRRRSAITGSNIHVHHYSEFSGSLYGTNALDIHYILKFAV